jgi:hypothetical protein
MNSSVILKQVTTGHCRVIRYSIRHWPLATHHCISKENPVMPRKIFHCSVCGEPENRCQCEKYCALCQSDYGVRLTGDGQYYCADCREACDYQTQENV